MFNTHNITIYREVVDAELCGVDNYNHPKKCLTLVRSTIGDFQQKNAREYNKDSGIKQQEEDMLYVPGDTDIQSNDKVMVEGIEGYFRVVGRPRKLVLFDRIQVKLAIEG